MKKITFLFTAVSILFLTSCADNNDLNVIDQGNATSRLQSYTLKKDAQGKYTIDIKTKDNTSIDSYHNQNSKDLVISDSRSEMNTVKTENLGYVDNLFEVNILDEINGKKTSIVIEDENTNFAKTSVTEFLKMYSVTKNTDNTYTLDFEVNDNVATEFIYNEDKKTHEIHLSKGESNEEKTFSRTLTKEHDLLIMEFINHYSKQSSRSSESSRNKPKVIIDHGDIY